MYYESDMIAKPDPSTFQVLPWRAEAPGTARMFCDILMPDGSPSFADPRYVLKRALAKTSDLGFTFYTHPEIEFFLLKDRPLDGSRPTRPTTPATSTTPRRTSAWTSAARRSPCWSRWASGWSFSAARAPPASRRSTCATPTRSPRPTTS